MIVTEWLKTARPMSTARLIVAHEDAFVAAVLDNLLPKGILVCLRPLSDHIAMEAALTGRRKPDLFVSTGMVQDSERLVEDAPRDPVIIAADVLARHKSAKHDQLAKMARLLSGYDVDPEILQRAAAHATRSLVISLQQRRQGLLVLAGLDAQELAAVAPDGAAAVELPEPKASLAAPISVPQPRRPEEKRDTIDPTYALVGKHAQFIVNNTLETLNSMHEQFSGPLFTDLFDIWCGNLGLLVHEPQHRDIATLAVSRLRQVQAMCGAAETNT